MVNYKHISKKGVEKALEEIQLDIKNYNKLISDICKQIKEYYESLPNLYGKIPKLIIGLSGGIDSSVVAYLAVKAVGCKNVITINMPAFENDLQVKKAKIIAKKLGVEHYTIPIKTIIDKEVKVINSLDSPELRINAESNVNMDRMRIGNFASRTRVAILYDIARKIYGKILGTGNRTEFVQGYAAKWGTPISFDFGVLDELYKIDIYELAKVLKIPKETIEAKPTTGYFPEQTHEEELGSTLKEQDALAFLLFQKKMNALKIIKNYGVSQEFIEIMKKRYKNSFDKRILRQPHVKIRNLGN